MTTLKRLGPALFGVVLLVSCLLSIRARAADPKIAVVDLYKAVAETEDGRKAKKQLESYFNKKQKKLDAKSEKLKSKMEALKKKEDVLDKEEYDKEVATLQEEIITLQNVYSEYQKKVLDKEMTLTEPILAKLEDILKRIGQKEGYTIILRKEAVAWAPNYTDITDKVIQAYNKEPTAFKSKGKTEPKKKKKKSK